jgi:hypothetical protein
MGEKIISQFENNAKQNKPFIPSKYKKKAEFDRGGGGHHNKNRQQLDSD